MVKLPFDRNIVVAQQLVFGGQFGVHLLKFLDLLFQTGRFGRAGVY